MGVGRKRGVQIGWEMWSRGLALRRRYDTKSRIWDTW
jgi:hypothetical protein